MLQLKKSVVITNKIPAILAALVITIAFAQNSQAGAKIIIPDATFNFGKVPQNCAVSKTFWVKSVGDDTLRILKVDPGCGCTQVPLKDSVLAPGDSSSFQIIFSTHSYRGYITKKPVLTTNADEEKITCEINAEVIVDLEQLHPVRMNPYKLDVSQFTVEPRRNASAWIKNLTDQDLGLALIDSTGKDFVLKFPDAVKANDSVEIVVTVNEDAIEREFDQSFTFYVADDEHTRFSLPIKRMYRVPVQEEKSPK